nr:protein FAR1-related sequence 5-like [Tanacetum cinerariifolium]
MKRTAEKEKSSEPIGNVTLRWSSDEETLLAECFVAVFDDRNVGRSQPMKTLWFRVLNEFNRKNFTLDGAMRLAAEFPESKHRLCMWHIMQKIPAKIVSRNYDDTDFKDKFGKIVWNMFIGLEEFEDRWNKLMEEFNLLNHKWLSKMYRLRSSWVPAFFVDSPLCGLMRTTYRSESENSFFSYFTSSGSTLVKFMLCYVSAMERQRHAQEKLDHQSFDSFPALLTPLPIKEHAAKVYTRNLFTRVQKEIVAGSWLCLIIVFTMYFTFNVVKVFVYGTDPRRRNIRCTL